MYFDQFCHKFKLYIQRDTYFIPCHLFVSAGQKLLGIVREVKLIKIKKNLKKAQSLPTPYFIIGRRTRGTFLYFLNDYDYPKQVSKLAAKAIVIVPAQIDKNYAQLYFTRLEKNPLLIWKLDVAVVASRLIVTRQLKQRKIENVFLINYVCCYVIHLTIPYLTL